MANRILTIDMITRESLRILENELVVTRNCNRQYDKSFAVEGAKIGDTLRIRLPDRVVVSDGAVFQNQAENQQYTTLTVSSQKHVGCSFTSAEMTMSLQDYSDTILKPRISQLAASIDFDVAVGVAKQIAQSVGTPGTTPSTSQVVLAAGQKLNESAITQAERYAVVNPAANAALVEGFKGFYNPQGAISNQYKSGNMGNNTLGFDEFNMSQSIGMFTTGSRTAVGTMGATVAAQGQATLTLAGMGNTKTIKQGEVLTVAGVYSVNPQTRQTTGSLAQFVVLADATSDAGGAATVTVAPIYSADAASIANQALATTDTLPQNTAVVTFLGAASTAYPQNLFYQKDSIAFATADLILPNSTEMASRQTHNGISLRIIKAYDPIQDQMVNRIDVLYGYKVIRPEGAVRCWG